MSNGTRNKPVDVLFIGHLQYFKLMKTRVEGFVILNVWYSNIKVKFTVLGTVNGIENIHSHYLIINLPVHCYNQIEI